MAKVTVKNVGGVVRELNRRIKKKVKAGQNALISAGFHIQGESQRITPVDTGNLKASTYTNWSDGGSKSGGRGGIGAGRGEKGQLRKAEQKVELQKRKAELQSSASFAKFKVEVGCTAAYAIFVHENSRGASFRTGTSRFLALAVKKNMRKIVDMVREASKDE